MKIQDLFERKIDRSINGVVKADQLDKFSVWQELDEFVVTKELTKHISALVETLKTALDGGPEAAAKNGVWVSGFFGCGKSHFIKVLSYLFENHDHEYKGTTKRAVDFFEDKISDAMLYGDLKTIVANSTETILFNIDTKADHRNGRDALLQVFLKVLNENQNFSGDHPHIAHMERHLEGKGKLEDFQAAYEQASGSSWFEERDAWEFHRDEVVEAMVKATGQSADSAEALVDNAEENFSLTIENFAKWVKQYLDKQGSKHRIMFLVDEVGQFIGSDTHMMLNLQSITEELGTICDGRAWVVVTSQEDLDAVLGDCREIKQHDFSKIQGRFETKLSLSSTNVDEVIKQRLLAKNEAATAPLAAAFKGKKDILRNQLSFVDAGMSFKHYADEKDFAACYPFAAYQFILVQKVFESIRKAGATGQHLAQGERSILDAFQSSAKQLSGSDIGALSPFYNFYPSVEGFLDTNVKRTIDQAVDNHALVPFDTTLLKLLFLIRYIKELPGNVDNLVTLCVDEIDVDKLSLRRQIEESLARLEGQTLIARNGDRYFFLTDEERDIGREIKGQAVPPGAEEGELGKLIFEDILKDNRKHIYTKTGKDFTFSRMCDDHVVGHKIEGSLEVAMASPVGDNYAEFKHNEGCVLHSLKHEERVLVKLPDDETLGQELRTYLQTESYVRTKNNGGLPESTKQILRHRSDDNRTRRTRLVLKLKDMLGNASYYANGQALDIGSSDPKTALEVALESLIENAYPKMDYIKHQTQNPKQEIQSTLRANDIEQLALSGEESNVKALKDMREYIRLCRQTSKQIILRDLIADRYGKMPYGWPEDEVVLLVTRLAVLKEIHLTVNSAPLALESAYDHLTSTNKQRKVVISQREVADKDVIKKAQAVGKDLFGHQGPGAEDDLFEHLQKQLKGWGSDLAGYETLAKTGKYPGQVAIVDSLAGLRKFVDEENSLVFLKRFAGAKGELIEISEDYQELHGFYTNQKHSWEELQEAVAQVSQNRLQLEVHETAGPALARMEEILKAERPYGMLHESQDLIHKTKEANDQLVSEERKPAMATIQSLLDSIGTELDKVNAPDALRSKATFELQGHLKTAATTAGSIAHIAQAAHSAIDSYDRALTAIEESQVPVPSKDDEPTATGGTATGPVIKPRRHVNPKALWTSAFIETQVDVDKYLNGLRSELEAGIKAGERIQLK